jgi:hypothetical protein
MPNHRFRPLLALSLIALLTTILNVAPTQAAWSGAPSVSWTGASGVGTGDGLTLKSASGPTITTDFGRTAAKVSPDVGAGYLWFDVDYAYMPNGTAADAQIEVSYFDRGYSYFYIVYDAPTDMMPYKDSFTWGAFNNTDPSRNGYQANNIVYLQNSNTWKTYKFNLSGWVPAGTDFKITYAKGEPAQQGYDLRIDRVTVTKSATPIDVTGQFEGNYSGFGGPAWVWTQLGTTNEQGHGLYQDQAAAATTVASAGGKTGRRLASGSAYFNVNDNYLKNGADGAGVPIASVVIGVEYFDAGGGTFSVKYDSTAGTERETGSVALTNTNTWRRAPFYITDGRFNNALTGGNDFRVVSSTGTLIVRDVVLTRTVGENRQGAVPTGFSRTQRVVGVHHTPVFDGFRPSLWERSTLTPSGTGADGFTANAYAQSVVNTNYSFRNVATHVKELTDMRDAGIDFALFWYAGNSQEANVQGVVAVRQFVEAARQVTNAPKAGLLLDPVMVQSDPFFRVSGEKLNLSDPAIQGLFIKLAEDYFSLVPRSQWATIEGRPVIALYYQMDDVVSRQDPGVIAKLRERFAATHGVQPYIVADRMWDPSDTLGLPVDEWFSWGAALCPSCPDSSPGFAQRSVFEVGPGFNDGTRVRDRQSGAFYSGSWDRAIAKGNHMVFIDTFNYFVEGTAIGETREYGRAYLDITRTKAAAFKAANYSASSTARVTLGATNTSQGVAQDDVTGQLTTADPRGGRRALANSMSFSVDDSYVLDSAGQVTVTVEYLDAGVNIIDLKYVGLNGQEIGPVNRINVRDSNTGQFKTATFAINDASFGNRMTFGNDLRLDTDVAGGLVIKSLSIQRACTTPAPTAGGAALPALPSGYTRTFVPVVYRNACAS